MRVILVSFLFLLVSCGNPPVTNRDIRGTVGTSVVRIFSTEESGFMSGGTGFSVKAESGRKYILTNKHICNLADAKGLLDIEFPGLKRKYKRKVIEISATHDLCLVESLPTFTSSLTVADELTAGTSIFVVGHPKLFALTVAEGEFIEEASIRVATSKGVNNPVIIPRNQLKLTGGDYSVVTYASSRFNVYSRGGNSGSPIVNSRGKVISVLFAGNPRDIRETYGVPLRFVKDFIKGY